MSSLSTPPPVQQVFRIFLDNVEERDTPRTISLDLNSRFENSGTGRIRIVEMTRSAVAIASSSTVTPRTTTPELPLHLGERALEPTQGSSTSYYATSAIIDGGDYRDETPPAYSRFSSSSVLAIPAAPVAPLPRVPSPIVWRPHSSPPCPPQLSELPPPPSTCHILYDPYEPMRRGELNPAVLVDDELEHPALPVDSNGRRRRRRYEEEDDNEDSDYEEERQAKRSRVSWGERWNTSIRNLIALVHPVQKRMLSRGQVFNRYSAYQVFAVAGFEFSSENQEY
ncbi:hypothetical protein B0H13DRAFT_1871727 [Mycena leptocephala]|nr:hypothetical protein B0H13DRAFT_1871727 [Mycena leptocephala]